MLIRFEIKKISQPEDLVSAVTADASANEGKVKQAESRIVNALIWASSYMKDSRVCYPVLQTEIDHKERNTLLRKTLVYLSHKLMSDGDKRVARLWTNMFGPMLQDAETTFVQGADAANKPSIHKYVALHSDGKTTQWPTSVLSLFDIVHKKANATQINELWSSHRELFYCQECGAKVFDPAVATGLLSLSTGTLPTELTKELLNRGSSQELEIQNSERAVVLIRDAIELRAAEFVESHSAQSLESFFNLAPGDFKNHVLRATRRYLREAGHAEGSREEQN
jgi:hypothetical protein